MWVRAVTVWASSNDVSLLRPCFENSLRFEFLACVAVLGSRQIWSAGKYFEWRNVSIYSQFFVLVSGKVLHSANFCRLSWCVVIDRTCGKAEKQHKKSRNQNGRGTESVHSYPNLLRMSHVKVYCYKNIYYKHSTELLRHTSQPVDKCDNADSQQYDHYI